MKDVCLHCGEEYTVKQTDEKGEVSLGKQGLFGLGPRPKKNGEADPDLWVEISELFNQY